MVENSTKESTAWKQLIYIQDRINVYKRKTSNYLSGTRIYQKRSLTLFKGTSRLLLGNKDETSVEDLHTYGRGVLLYTATLHPWEGYEKLGVRDSGRYGSSAVARIVEVSARLEKHSKINCIFS